MNTNGILFIVLLLSLGLIAYLKVPRFMTRSYAPWVIKLFEEQKAIDSESALPLETLLPVPFMHHIFRHRDYIYKRMALDELMRSNVVSRTADGRFFLVRKNLQLYRLKR